MERSLPIQFRSVVNGRGAARLIGTMLAAVLLAASAHAAHPGAEGYKQKIQPLLEEFCYTCHAEGDKSGGISFDEFASEEAFLNDRELWFKVLKNVRAGIMPPAKKDQPSADQKKLLDHWIKYQVFGIDPAHPDPGRVTLRRLNRVEYANTVRDLMGVEFRADEEFPPDDTGHGFDNIGDVLSVSPLLLEKYMQAAEQIVTKAVPTTSRLVREVTIEGRRFRREAVEGEDENKPTRVDDNDDDPRGRRGEMRSMTFYKPAKAAATHKVDQPGSYHVTLELNVRGEFVFDPGKCNVTFKADDKELLKKEFGWANGKTFTFEFDEQWEPGEKKFTFELQPLTPEDQKKNSLDMRILSVQVRGPMEREKWGRPERFDRFFTKDAPDGDTERRQYAREVLSRFATRAFRRPVDEKTAERLTTIAEAVYKSPGKSFEQGIAQAMVAVLASPRFIFRVEDVQPGGGPDDKYPLVDEYALASRLSYFLWSTMPDEELLRLAEKGELRKNLPAQVKRMLSHERSEALVENFVGQWLQVRDVDGIAIDGRVVLARDQGLDREMQKAQEERRALFAKIESLPEAERQKEFEKIREQFRNRRRFRGPEFEFDEELRRAMRRESEEFFRHIIRDDNSVLDLLDADYTFLNERLARHYGIDGIKGREMRKVILPADNPRGGLLTQAAVLVVTSNPTRTSPVKRGLFVLENVLGTPPAPPPPDLPTLEEAEKEFKDKDPTLREVLQLHRANPLCSSCHNRMDPLGLALENFNALGMWRDTERKAPIEAAGKLITGEQFKDVRELKKVLRETRKADFYRCLAEKVMTYALGRGVEYHDVEAVDQVVDRLEKEDGKFSALLTGIVESAPFQRTRAAEPAAPPAQQQAAVQ